jgi:hypothetical protein
MSVKAGVWIDHQQAVLVLITDADKEIKKIASGVEGPVRSRSHNSYTPNDFTAEDRLERKFDSHLKVFYDEVIASLQGSEAILILGPGEAKGELHKRLASKKLRGLVVEVETADKMTDRQLAAKVAQHFAAIPAKSSISAKDNAQKKTLR